MFNSIVGQSTNGTLVLVSSLVSLDMRGCHANSAWRLHLRHMRRWIAYRMAGHDRQQPPPRMGILRMLALPTHDGITPMRPILYFL